VYNWVPLINESLTTYTKPSSLELRNRMTLLYVGIQNNYTTNRIKNFNPYEWSNEFSISFEGNEFHEISMK